LGSIQQLEDAVGVGISKGICFKGGKKMTYQKITGPLMANSHPGSYCGQDAYTDMFVTETKNESDKFRDVPLHNGRGKNDAVESKGLQRSNQFSRGGGEMETVVRRLTPTECERLQGFPDGWTDIGEWTDTKGKLHKESSDSARYKALGNSIALPFWFYLLRRISAQYERPATLGSLFDGIGGFPLCWERCNGRGTARWASEIEEFPIAVTMYWFEEGNEKW
jgi:site-specific DNA-cytosine methylase